jgi:hypothetical protein
MNPAQPIQYVTGDRVIGQFYNSQDKLYHLAEYVPYALPPTKYLCGKTGNYSPSRNQDQRPMCSHCWTICVLKAILAKQEKEYSNDS